MVLKLNMWHHNKSTINQQLDVSFNPFLIWNKLNEQSFLLAEAHNCLIFKGCDKDKKGSPSFVI